MSETLSAGKKIGEKTSHIRQSKHCRWYIADLEKPLSKMSIYLNTLLF